jgi:hypothetical protein
VNISVHFLVFLNRERRNLGFSYAMPSPPIERILGFTMTTSELNGAFLAGLYAKYTEFLTAKGFIVEDVLEPTPEASQQSSGSTQQTPPTPPPPEEPPA